ncbi:MAG: malectin domain-containing carbohydrate-binding protein [Anaerolineae bacterium]
MYDRMLTQMPQTVRRLLPTLLAALGLAIVLGGAVPLTSFGAPPDPSLQISAPTSVPLNYPIIIRLNLKNAKDVGGYEMTLHYDTSVAEIDRLHQRQNDMRKFGRDVGPLGPVERPDGVTFGLYSCPFGNCVNYKKNDNRQAHGANGNVFLAEFALTPRKAGTLEIKIDNTQFVGPDGTPFNVTMPAQTLRVQVGDPNAGPFFPAPAAVAQPAPHAPTGAAGPFDLTGDGVVAHADSMAAALDWTTMRHKGLQCGAMADAREDVNHDGCLDVADLQAIAYNYSTDPTARRSAASPNGGASAKAETDAASPDAASADTAAADTASPSAAAAVASVFTVNSTSDADDANIGNGVCATAGGVCTLRAAIEEANAHSGPDTINFNIPGSGVQTIHLNAALPALNDMSGGTTIDGYTQPGSSPNTDPLVSNAVIRIAIQGPDETSYDAFPITSGNNVLRGLSIYQVHAKVHLYGSGANNNTIVGCFIGTDPAGTYVASAISPDKLADGFTIEIGSSNNIIGTPALADRNVISGNSFNGIDFKNEGTNGTIIKNNLIGLSPNGQNGIKNWHHGIDVNVGSSYNVIGGTGANERNVIAGNGASHIELSHDTLTTGNRIIGNFLGTDPTGTFAPSWGKAGEFGIMMEDGVNGTIIDSNVIGNTPYEIVDINYWYTTNNQLTNNRIGVSLNGTPLPSGGSGVWVDWPASGNKIGPNNIIANTPGNGVMINHNESVNNLITRNAIYNNAQLGIDLGYLTGVNPIGSGGPGSMANNGIDYPILLWATPTQVIGTGCAGCTAEIFIAQRNINDTGKGWHGQSKTFVGSGTIASNGTFSIALSGVAPGDFLTATATDSQGDTSEFSFNIPVGYGTTVRINAAGGEYLGGNDFAWDQDTQFSGGNKSSTTNAIANTADPTLYQTQRYGNFSYNLSVPNGTYQVKLKFAETYWTSKGQRVFNVAINGQQVLSNFDILSQVAPNTALDYSFPVTVTNGAINIAFTKVVDNATVGAVEVVPQAPVRINAGDGAYRDSSGQGWSGDTAFSGGTTSSTTANIAGTSDPRLYQTYRFGNFSYSVPVPNGNYQVNLKFAESYWTTTGKRVFNVAINGQTVLSNFDVLSQAAPKTALDKSFPVTVTNGAVNIVFTTVADNAMVSAIEIVPSGGSNPTPIPPPPTPTPTATPSAGSTYRINTGDGAYTSGSGQVWSADANFSGGNTYSMGSAISGTSDPTLYQSERYGYTFSYNLPVTNGNYQVTLKFAEIYWTSAGQRVFNVAINGQQVLSNFDILSQVAPKTALDKSFPVTVTNGTINIAFSTVTDNAKISAIQVVPGP